MRERDVQKQKAVIEATIKVINEIGFVSASISKIAKEAGVSVGTIYIYYENKEDLVVSIYYEVKKDITSFLYQDLDETMSVEQNFKVLWENTIKAGAQIVNLISYSEQFANSPFYDLIDHSKIYELMQPILDLIKRGVEEKTLKDISIEVFVAFFIIPATFLANRKKCASFDVSTKNIDDTFQLAWNTIKK